MPKNITEFRFYEELNDFLPKERKKKSFYFEFNGNPSVKDTIEAIGVPHVEVDLILVNGKSVDFKYILKNNDKVSVYPVFERLNISDVTKLRKEPLRNTKFILDVHLGKLTKYLRLLGFDSHYKNDLDDNQIIDISLKEKRIILTRDKGILKNDKVTHGYWIRSQDPKKQLEEVVETFDLSNKIKLFSICSICNGLVSKVKKKEIIEQLKPKTRENYDIFYQCRNCGKVYWEGSHVERMRGFINGVLRKKIVK